MQARAPAKGPQDDLAILSLNLRFGHADDGPNNWPARKVAYKPLVNAYPSDFYLFQEANDFQVDFLADLLAGYGKIGQRHPAPEFWQNNVIFFHPRWTCVESAHFYLSQTPDVPSQYRDSKWPRQCTMGAFQYNSRKVTLINTHFDFKAAVQQRSARLIVGRLQQFGDPCNVILAGDFNAEPDSLAYRVLTRHDVGFKNAFVPPLTGTHHGFSGNAQAGPIDWILFRGALGVVRSEVITDQFADFYPSDHFPIAAAFRWQE